MPVLLLGEVWLRLTVVSCRSLAASWCTSGSSMVILGVGAVQGGVQSALSFTSSTLSKYTGACCLSGWVGCCLPVPRLGSVQLSTEVTQSGGMRDTAFPVSSKGHTYQGTLSYASYSILRSTVWYYRYLSPNCSLKLEGQTSHLVCINQGTLRSTSCILPRSTVWCQLRRGHRKGRP